MSYRALQNQLDKAFARHDITAIARLDLKLSKMEQEMQATVIVHWTPGQSIPMCEEHRYKANQIARAMGMAEPTATPITEPTNCSNCVNEAEKK